MVPTRARLCLRRRAATLPARRPAHRLARTLPRRCLGRRLAPPCPARRVWENNPGVASTHQGGVVLPPFLPPETEAWLAGLEPETAVTYLRAALYAGDPLL